MVSRFRSRFYSINSAQPGSVVVARATIRLVRVWQSALDLSQNCHKNFFGNSVRLWRINVMSEFTTRPLRFYALYFKEDSEKTEVAVGDSISEVLADVQAQTGRPFLDFQFREISRSEFESFSPVSAD